MFRPFFSGLVLAALIVPMVGVGSAAARPEPEGPNLTCGNVMLLTVRGSGDPLEAGPYPQYPNIDARGDGGSLKPGQKFYYFRTQLETALERRGQKLGLVEDLYSSNGVTYPAAPIEPASFVPNVDTIVFEPGGQYESGLNSSWNVYADSAVRGSVSLVSLANHMLAQCPKASLVLVGHSQGGQVIATALTEGALNGPKISDPTRVAAVTFGDARFEGSNSMNFGGFFGGGKYDASVNGVAATFGLGQGYAWGERPALPDAINAGERFVSVCHGTDFVCQANASNLYGLLNGMANTSPYKGAYEQWHSTYGGFISGQPDKGQYAQYTDYSMVLELSDKEATMAAFLIASRLFPNANLNDPPADTTKLVYEARKPARTDMIDPMSIVEPIVYPIAGGGVDGHYSRFTAETASGASVYSNDYQNQALRRATVNVSWYQYPTIPDYSDEKPQDYLMKCLHETTPTPVTCSSTFFVNDYYYGVEYDIRAASNVIISSRVEVKDFAPVTPYPRPSTDFMIQQAKTLAFMEYDKLKANGFFQGMSVPRSLNVGVKTSPLTQTAVTPTPPVVQVGGPYTGYVGAANGVLVGSNSYDMYGTITRYQWDINGDGNYECDSPRVPTCMVPTPTGPTVVPVRLKVTNSFGLTSETSSTVTFAVAPSGATAAPAAPTAPTVTPLQGYAKLVFSPATQKVFGWTLLRKNTDGTSTVAAVLPTQDGVTPYLSDGFLLLPADGTQEYGLTAANEIGTSPVTWFTPTAGPTAADTKKPIATVTMLRGKGSKVNARLIYADTEGLVGGFWQIGTISMKDYKKAKGKNKGLLKLTAWNEKGFTYATGSTQKSLTVIASTVTLRPKGNMVCVKAAAVDWGKNISNIAVKCVK